MAQVSETIETDRLRLRRPRRSDAAAMLTYCTDPMVMRYMHFAAHTGIDEVYGFLDRCRERWESGDEHCWVVTRSGADACIGHIAVRIRQSEASFGYLLHRGHWGEGLATEAARAVVQIAFANPEILRVWATCDVDNVRSARVLEKAGLALEARRRSAEVRPNIGPDPRDDLLFARDRCSSSK